MFLVLLKKPENKVLLFMFTDIFISKSNTNSTAITETRTKKKLSLDFQSIPIPQATCIS